MKNYSEYVKKLSDLFAEAEKIPLGAKSDDCFTTAKSAAKARIEFKKICDEKYAKASPKALVFAPHPDDESMVGALALRFMRECGFEIKDVAVTLGSNKARRAGRLAELTKCCKRLSWGLIVCGNCNGFDNIRPDSRGTPAWNKAAREVAKIIKDENPIAIFAPHKSDWNKTHCGVALLIADALKIVGQSFTGILFETEYWGAMDSPNLMVDVPCDILAKQIEATSCHTKEVERNPYHVRIPSWMSDNVRRGGEIVGGQGGAVPDFDFAILLRAKVRTARGWKDALKNAFLSKDTNASTLFAK